MYLGSDLTHYSCYTYACSACHEVYDSSIVYFFSLSKLNIQSLKQRNWKNKYFSVAKRYIEKQINSTSAWLAIIVFARSERALQINPTKPPRVRFYYANASKTRRRNTFLQSAITDGVLPVTLIFTTRKTPHHQ